MSHRRLWISAAIIALVIIIGFVFSVPHTRDVEEVSLRSTGPESVPEVSLRDSYRRGVHTITGSLTAPNACTEVSATAELLGSASTTESIAVRISMPADDGVCLQLPTRVSFETKLSAPAELPFTVFVNGAVASTSGL